MESLDEIFNKVCEYCIDNKLITQVAYATWLNQVVLQNMEDNYSTAILIVKSDFTKSLIDQKLKDKLAIGFENVLGFPVDLQIYSETGKQRPVHDEKALTAKGGLAKELTEGEDALYVPADKEGEYEYTFSTFIVGPSNKFAHAASMAVASNPAKAYNPLFIYGGSGLGKTHLLLAIGNEIAQRQPGTNVVYAKSEDFTNELIDSIAKETTKEFHDKYRMADVLLMDDIQFIGGKESTQEEFFHTFNTLYQAGKQIVLTSDRPPKEIKTLEDRLRTRFEWGLLADIQPPDFETRVAIIRRKAELLNLNMPDEVADYIANRLKNNIRQLEGTVKKLKAFQAVMSTPVTIMAAQNAIRDILNDNQPVPVTVERIIAEVARTCSVTPQDIRSTKRAAQISTARQAAVYIVRDITQMSMSAIGTEFGGRDHSTIVYAIQQVEAKMQDNPKYRAMIEDIIKNIRDS